MTTTHDSARGGGWDQLGRAAEDFARRVADDARRFATRVEEHVEELAHDVRREWRCGHGRDRAWSPEDVRRVFTDVRNVLGAVLDGVDELIGGVLHREAEWRRVVTNRAVTCAACRRTIGPGDEAYVHGVAAAREFRCVACGVPTGSPPS